MQLENNRIVGDPPNIGFTVIHNDGELVQFVYGSCVWLPGGGGGEGGDGGSGGGAEAAEEEEKGETADPR